MIRIHFQEPVSASWIAWKADCAQAQASVNADVAAGKTPSIRSALYGRLKQEFFTSPDGPFKGKCAFCESRITSDQHGDVEHFRPKGAVHDETNQPLRLGPAGALHPGYYWLAYEWSNLLPSCVLCNQPSTQRDGTSLGKRNYFPLINETERATAPGMENQEKPLLINPCHEDPTSHLGLDETGVMFARDGSPRGIACIRLFGLNNRALPAERRRKFEDTENVLKMWLNATLAGDTASAKKWWGRVEDMRNGSEAYTMASRLAAKSVLSIIDAARSALGDG